MFYVVLLLGRVEGRFLAVHSAGVRNYGPVARVLFPRRREKSGGGVFGRYHPSREKVRGKEIWAGMHSRLVEANYQLRRPAVNFRVRERTRGGDSSGYVGSFGRVRRGIRRTRERVHPKNARNV